LSFKGFVSGPLDVITTASAGFLWLLISPYAVGFGDSGKSSNNEI
jgi:hypothetical protein